jgi:ribosome modulation factor
MAKSRLGGPHADGVPIVVRLATWVGRTIGRWQRQRVARKGDAYVLEWKHAWSTGRDARLAGAPREAAPHRGRAQRDAWLAGWLWADMRRDHPERNGPRSAQPAAPGEKAAAVGHRDA